MSDAQPDDALREVSPGVWRGSIAGYTVAVFRVESRWVAQAFSGSDGVNHWADSKDDAEQRVRGWIQRNPAKPHDAR
jgi:broad specificity phosphatase PhoE